MKKVAKKTAMIKTKYGSYKAIFEPETDMGGYVVTAPRVQGAVSWGRNLTEAKKMIAECIEGSIIAHAILDAERQGTVRFVKTAMTTLA